MRFRNDDRRDMLRRLQVENALWTHAEQQVQNGQVGQETMLVLEHLPILFCLEGRIGLGVLGVDDVAIIGEE